MIDRNFQAKSIAVLRNPSRIFWVTCGIAAVINILTALTGAFRPYDAIPDQDLLWLKEGLRLFSSLHVTYPDHPGIYWSLSYALKIKILSTLHLISISPGQEITIEDAQIIISLSRIENGILIGLSAALTWPICRLIPISRSLTSIVVISSALSLGFLDATAQTRNEITSFFISSAIHSNLFICPRQGTLQTRQAMYISAHINLLLAFRLLQDTNTFDLSHCCLADLF